MKLIRFIDWNDNRITWFTRRGGAGFWNVGGSKLGGLGRKPDAGEKFFLELHVAFSAL